MTIASLLCIIIGVAGIGGAIPKVPGFPRWADCILFALGCFLIAIGVRALI